MTARSSRGRVILCFGRSKPAASRTFVRRYSNRSFLRSPIHMRIMTHSQFAIAPASSIAAAWSVHGTGLAAGSSIWVRPMYEAAKLS